MNPEVVRRTVWYCPAHGARVGGTCFCSNVKCNILMEPIGWIEDTLNETDDE